jgi:hypothetical protein
MIDPNTVAYVSGFFTPFVLAFVFALGLEAKDRVQRWWGGRRPSVTAYARCHICGGGFHAEQKRRVREMYADHMEREHGKPS